MSADRPIFGKTPQWVRTGAVGIGSLALGLAAGLTLGDGKESEEGNNAYALKANGYAVDASSGTYGFGIADPAQAPRSVDTVLPKPTPEPFLKLPLIEESIAPEVYERVIQNIHSIGFSPTPDYADKFGTNSCSAFLIRDRAKKPILITANHCMPASEMKSPVDSQVYKTVDDNGLGILSLNGKNPLGESYSILSWPSNLIKNNPRKYDVAAIDISNSVLIRGLGLPINEAPLLGFDDTYFQFTMIDNRVVVSTMHFISFEPNTNRIHFIDLADQTNVCKPGTSGSAIVNRAGEVVGITTNYNAYVLTPEMVSALNLDPVHIGRAVTECIAVSTRVLFNMINN